MRSGEDDRVEDNCGGSGVSSLRGSPSLYDRRYNFVLIIALCPRPLTVMLYRTVVHLVIFSIIIILSEKYIVF